MEKYELKMFMAHLPLCDLDQIEQTLQQYDITSYVIAVETEPYEHYHFLVKMGSNTDYHNFKQTVFIKKYKLRGRAIKDQPRQYGKVTNINDVEKAYAYTLKSKNTDLIRTNLKDEEIEEFMEKSYKKKDLKKQLQDMIKDIYIPPDETELKKIQTNMIRQIYTHIIKNDTDLSLSRTAINSYYVKVLRNKFQKDDILINLLMYFNNHFNY